MNATLSARARAVAAQRAASDPLASAWVGASAGSGKTKVLTDRVLRLLLTEGAEPGRILCLTFTKAAAAEMATRLARRLGEWAVAGEEALRSDLYALTGREPGEGEARAARRLFCRVLEQPGGMRISTIHAFCQSLLRSFPLEAGLPPAFALVEEADSEALLDEAREAVLAGRLAASAAPAGEGGATATGLDGLARLASPDDLAAAVRALVRRRDRLPSPESAAGEAFFAAALRAALRLDPDETPDDPARRMCDPPDCVREAARTLAGHKNKTPRALGEAMLDHLARDRAARDAAAWWGLLHTDKGEFRAALRGVEALEREAARLAALRERERAHRMREATATLLSLATPVLADYAARKRRRGALDFDDLVASARRLLLDPGSAWVLFRLDGGLDHLLLDEAQDTSETQWGIADALTREFFAGEGARGPDAPPRTLFVVGDAKQSIFGFQGADARGFAAWQGRMGARVEAGGGDFRPVPLDVSFRSCASVLAAVDATFADPDAARGVVRPGGPRMRHYPDRAGQAGEVEAWPPLARHADERPTPWVVPEAPVAAQDAEAQLAECIAARIAHMVAHERLPARGGRRVRPGDVMVLVRRRTRLLPLLVRHLKRRGVPVGGVDRLKLGEQIAARDALALLDALLLPEDDLNLAALLKSPLVGLDEDALFRLCHGREGRLWDALLAHRGAGTPEGRAADMLAGLADRTDRVTPHALLGEVLGERGGRARLLARLGADAADALDELASAALRYEARHPPSLQGFVQWIRRGGAEVRREAEDAGDAVRIMTAHRSKGLQAPVVVLPDVGRGGGRETLLWHEAEAEGGGGPETGEGGGAAGRVPLPLWAPRKEYRAPLWDAAEAARRAREAEEENRLLYVALTRAEDRLVVCGVEPRKEAAEAGPSWLSLVRRGLDRLLADDAAAARREGCEARGEEFDPATAFGAPPGATFLGPVLRVSCPQTEAPVPDRPEDAAVAERHVADPAPLPPWATTPAPPEASEDPLAPSRLAGEETEPPAAAPHGRADPGGRRFRRGLLIHSLLQMLPEHPEAAREGVLRRHLARPGHALTREEQVATAAEVMGVLRHPALAEAFGPGSLAEAPIAGRVGGVAIAGQVDRLLVAPDRVVVVDYKTNRPPPSRAEDVAPAYLRQVAAYRAVLRAALPGRRVDAALVWTWSGAVMPLPDALLDAHAPGAAARPGGTSERLRSAPGPA